MSTPQRLRRAGLQLAPDTQTVLPRLLLGPLLTGHHPCIRRHRDHEAKAIGKQHGLEITSLRVLSMGQRAPIARSEEHTSELQSLMRSPYAVFCWNKQQTQK